jgi:hypothetical protein
MPCIEVRAERRISCGSSAVPDERVEHLPHRFWFAAHDRGGGLNIAGGIKVLPGDVKPVLRASCAKKARCARPLPACPESGRFEAARIGPVHAEREQPSVRQ